MRDRTADLLNANQALSQLSYSPVLLVFFTQFGVARLRSFRYVHKYVPSLAHCAPCLVQKILRQTSLMFSRMTFCANRGVS